MIVIDPTNQPWYSHEPTSATRHTAEAAQAALTLGPVVKAAGSVAQWVGWHPNDGGVTVNGYAIYGTIRMV